MATSCWSGYPFLENSRRLQQIPFILVSGGNRGERAKAIGHGGLDFVTRGGQRRTAGPFEQSAEPDQSKENLEADRERLVQDPVSGLYSRKYLELQAAQALSHAARHGIDVSVMVLGFDGFDGMCQRLGVEVAEEVCNRFGKMLAGKVRHEDSLGTTAWGSSPSSRRVPPRRSVRNLCRACSRGGEMALTIRGKRWPDRQYRPGQHAERRGFVCRCLSIWPANECIRHGCRRQSHGSRRRSGPATRPISLNHALELLAANRIESVPHLPAVGRLLPMLQLMDKGWVGSAAGGD